MLVLSRKMDERLVIDVPPGQGCHIEICVVDIRGDKIRVGVDAPKIIAVHRKEIWEEIQKAKGGDR